jgi:hypothetical protein
LLYCINNEQSLFATGNINQISTLTITMGAPLVTILAIGGTGAQGKPVVKGAYSFNV